MKKAFGDTTMQAMDDYKKINAELNKELLVDVNGMSDEQKKEHSDKITKLQEDLSNVSENIKIGDTKIEKIDDVISLVDQFIAIKPTEDAKLSEKNVQLNELNAEIADSEKYITDLDSGTRELTMEDFLKICDFFYLTPQEFFADYVPEISATCKKIIQRVKVLPHAELALVRDFLDDLEE